MPTPFLLAAALPATGAAPDPVRLLAHARAAEDAGFDLVTVEPGPADPLLVAARLAAQTSRIAVAPVTATTTTEPFHVSTALATIDVVAAGRAGWVLTVDDPAEVAGTVTWEPPSDAAGDAAEHLDAVRALWDSWEEDAVIRDVATARFLDRTKVHHVDLRGEHLAVRGPSITPRPPQGNPPVLVRATDAATLAIGRAHGDALLVGEGTALGAAAGGPSADGGAAPVAGPLATLLAAPGAPPVLVELAVDTTDDPTRTVERIAAHRAAGAAGVVLHAADPSRAIERLAGALHEAGLPRSTGVVDDPAPTLRDRLGLAPAVNRYAEVAR